MTIAAPSAALRSVVVPKVESVGDLAFIDRLLEGVERALGRDAPLAVQALIETAAGLSRVEEIATCPRLDTLILGYADLAASLGRPMVGGDEGVELWLPAQERVLAAARANGLQAVDGPHLGTRAHDAFRAAARRARDLGFDGKWAIHPEQVPVLNDLFTPTLPEIERARAVVAELERAEREGRGAVGVDGAMVDEAVRAGAFRILARAERGGPGLP